MTAQVRDSSGCDMVRAPIGGSQDTEPREERNPASDNPYRAHKKKFLIDWVLNTRCDFHCEYCPIERLDAAAENAAVGKFSPAHIARCFDKTGRSWEIHLSGGEPFLYPHFIELCEALTQHHTLSINTNLTSDSVTVFADRILPEKVENINASLHIMEREKRDNLLSVFMRHVRYLQDKGFKIRVEYVSYPPLFPKMAGDLEALRSLGARMVGVKAFVGDYQNREYPKSYTEAEKFLIRRYAIDSREEKLLEGKVSYFGQPCLAGRDFFRMDHEGNLTRCPMSFKRQGNLFEGKVNFDDIGKPCPFFECKCIYAGLRFAQSGKASILSTANEVLQELGSVQSSRRKVTARKVLRYLRSMF
jgi:MoaA/NifB/PqqE/SkfB family radical SAM enzyme